MWQCPALRARESSKLVGLLPSCLALTLKRRRSINYDTNCNALAVLVKFLASSHKTHKAVKHIQPFLVLLQSAEVCSIPMIPIYTSDKTTILCTSRAVTCHCSLLGQQIKGTTHASSNLVVLGRRKLPETLKPQLRLCALAIMPLVVWS